MWKILDIIVSIYYLFIYLSFKIMLYVNQNMTDKMLKFVKLGQQNPLKRRVLERKEDFNEIYKEFINEKAKEQSSRCSQCGVPFCQVHCPLSNNIPDWLKLTAEGRLKDAYELAQSTNNMPEVCGRICPQDRLCEGNCVIEKSGHGTVTIGSIEKFITENAWENKWVEPIKVRIEKKQSVGIIGAGPAGLACAEQLRKQGYQVTIYDRYDRAGGLLIYGIPNFKLEKFVVERRTYLLKRGGIKFIQNFEVGKDASEALLGTAEALEDAAEDVRELTAELGLHQEWIRYDGASQRIEIPLSVAEEIADHVTVPVQLVEVHPTHDRLEVGVVNLNQNR